MNTLNLINIGNCAEKQPFIIVDDTAFPIGYDTRNCTASADDIVRGKTAATSNGIVTGTLEITGNEYFFCTRVVSDTVWRGSSVTIENGVLQSSGREIELTYSGKAPQAGKIYDRTARFKSEFNGSTVRINLQDFAGTSVSTAFGMSFNGKADGEQEISYTAVDVPEWLSLDGNVLTGTPDETGTWLVKLKAETNDQCAASLVSILIRSVEAQDDGCLLYIPLTSKREYAPTGEYMVYGDMVTAQASHTCYTAPEYTVFDGYRCAKFVAGYDYSEENEKHTITFNCTRELAMITGNAARSVSFLGCPHRFLGESEYGSDTGTYACAVGWGPTHQQHRMFKVTPAYKMEYDEENGEESLVHVLCLSLWNADLEIDTKVACDNKMHHYAISMECTGNNAGTVKMYIDGSKFYEGWFEWGTPDTGNTPVSIGKTFDNDGYAYEGYLAEVKIWNRILTDSEVTAEYGRTVSLKQS